MNASDQNVLLSTARTHNEVTLPTRPWAAPFDVLERGKEGINIFIGRPRSAYPSIEDVPKGDDERAVTGCEVARPRADASFTYRLR